MRDKLPSDGSNAAREVGTSAQPPTLSSRLDVAQEVPHPPTSEVSLMPQPSPQPDASLPQGDITADVSVPDANTPLNANSDCVREHVSDYGYVDAMDNLLVALVPLLPTIGADRNIVLGHIERLEAENDELQSEVDAAIENMGNYRTDRERWRAKAEWLEAERVSASAAWGERDEYEQMYLKERAKAEWLAIQLEHRSADLWEAWLLSAEEATR